jgi:hypothetical protein
LKEPVREQLRINFHIVIIVTVPTPEAEEAFHEEESGSRDYDRDYVTQQTTHPCTTAPSIENPLL